MDVGGFFLIFEAVRTASTTQVARSLGQGPLRAVWRGVRLRAGLRGGGSGPTAHESVDRSWFAVHLLIVTTFDTTNLRLHVTMARSSPLSDLYVISSLDPPTE